MTTDYKDKIRKLLALAKNPNENEAQAALLKARELMAKYKLSEIDIKNDENNQNVKNVDTGITCTKRRNPWIVDLADIIGESYCCQGYRESAYGKQTQHIGFVGLENDVDICVFAFKYAVDCALSKTKEMTKKYKMLEYSSEYIMRLCNSYGYGFAYGIKKAFDKQQHEKPQEWGLVLVMPQEVVNATQHFGNHQFNSKAAEKGNISHNAFSAGYVDGSKFDLKHKLETNNTNRRNG